MKKAHAIALILLLCSCHTTRQLQTTEHTDAQTLTTTAIREDINRIVELDFVLQPLNIDSTRQRQTPIRVQGTVKEATQRTKKTADTLTHTLDRFTHHREEKRAKPDAKRFDMSILFVVFMILFWIFGKKFAEK